MFDGIIQSIQDFLLKVFGDPRVVVVLIAILPIVEARLAIPIAMGYGLGWLESWAWAFVGSSLIVPLLLLVLIPFIRWLGTTRLFKKAGTVLYEKFEKKAAGIKTENGAGGSTPDAPAPKKRLSGDFKKMLGVFVFVAIPLPLTGVWTGSAVASIIKLKYHKSVIAVIAGNFVASGIITLLTVCFSEYVNYIIAGFAAIAVIVVLVLIVKIILHKSPAPEAAETESNKED